MIVEKRMGKKVMTLNEDGRMERVYIPRIFVYIFLFFFFSVGLYH